MPAEQERRNCPHCGNLVGLFADLDGALCWDEHRYDGQSGESCDKSGEPVTAEDEQHESDLIQGYADAHPDDEYDDGAFCPHCLSLVDTYEHGGRRRYGLHTCDDGEEQCPGTGDEVEQVIIKRIDPAVWVGEGI